MDVDTEQGYGEAYKDVETALQPQIDTTHRQLVYELHGLTDDEIRIVEEATHT